MKIQTTSIIDQDRKEHKHQVGDQRNAILDAAQRLFLQKGLDQTTMADIARETGIHRVTLYRYFSDLHPIAFEVAVRMLKRIVETSDAGERPLTIQGLKMLIIRMIDQFDPLRDAYHYLGMFDHRYGTHYPSEELAAWYKAQIFELGWGLFINQTSDVEIFPGQVAMIANSTLSFMQKLAVRGDLLAGEQEVSLEEQLTHYKDMLSIYFDRLARSEQ